MIWLKVVIPAHYEPASIFFIWLVKVDFEKNISLIGNLKKISSTDKIKLDVFKILSDMTIE